jgi:hypothetical protein
MSLQIFLKTLSAYCAKKMYYWIVAPYWKKMPVLLGFLWGITHRYWLLINSAKSVLMCRIRSSPSYDQLRSWYFVGLFCISGIRIIFGRLIVVFCTLGHCPVFIISLHEPNHPHTWDLWYFKKFQIYFFCENQRNQIFDV